MLAIFAKYCQAVDLGADGVALAVEHDIASTRAVALDVPPKDAPGLVANEGQFGAGPSGILYHH
ncbi:hypothetical protein CKO42_03010 [Lamprobacter modestohalophilus]|uniref:Uncharacterized protein n=1 Tax=Lamprobacter modestohalophilus TaxID=1064514 RepID=A0A9X0W610_9GAMM|nr:hypothetical protein [Lamprobacter modestohalophilus]